MMQRTLLFSGHHLMKMLRVLTISENKKLTVLLLFVFLFVGYAECFAADSANIGGNDVIADGNIQTAPVYLSNNPGIMGYKISIEYPDGVEIKNINRGTLCQNGNFNTSLENHSGNIIDIVWNNTENITDDGSLFVISLKADPKTVNKELKITYSKDDTFNESWQDVALFCTGMSFTDADTAKTVISQETISDRDYNYIKTIIETELANSGIVSFEKTNEKTKNDIVKKVSDKLPDFRIKDIKDVKKLYFDSIKNGVVSEIIISADNETVHKIIDSSLKEIKAKGLDEIGEADLPEFNKTVAKKINSDYDGVLDGDFKKLDENSKLEVIKSIYENSGTKAETGGVRTEVIISIICVAVIVAVVAIVFIKKKRKGS